PAHNRAVPGSNPGGPTRPPSSVREARAEELHLVFVPGGKEPNLKVKILGQIETLEALAGLDVELGSIDEQLTEQREAFTRKKELLDQLGTRLAVSRESLIEMERTRNDLMAELRQMGGQVEKSREKLSRCRTEREANAAQREVEEIR